MKASSNSTASIMKYSTENLHSNSNFTVVLMAAYNTIKGWGFFPSLKSCDIDMMQKSLKNFIMERPFAISQLWATTKENAVVINSEKLEYTGIVTYFGTIEISST